MYSSDQNISDMKKKYFNLNDNRTKNDPMYWMNEDLDPAFGPVYGHSSV